MYLALMILGCFTTAVSVEAYRSKPGVWRLFRAVLVVACTLVMAALVAAEAINYE